MTMPLTDRPKTDDELCGYTQAELRALLEFEITAAVIRFQAQRRNLPLVRRLTTSIRHRAYRVTSFSTNFGYLMDNRGEIYSWTTRMFTNDDYQRYLCDISDLSPERLRQIISGVSALAR